MEKEFNNNFLQLLEELIQKKKKKNVSIRSKFIRIIDIIFARKIYSQIV